MNPRDLDNWITGHYGEDYFKDEDAMDDKQDVTIHIATSLPIKEAETLAEFLNDLINKVMGKEAIVSYTKDADDDEPLVLKGPTLDDLMKE